MRLPPDATLIAALLVNLQTRLAELGNIRGFLTGSLLTWLLIPLFSVIYIAVMVVYSGVLTAVTLGVIPLFWHSPSSLLQQLRPSCERQLKKCGHPKFAR